MKRIANILPVLLAVALQIMPLVRNLFVNPATGSNFAFILRWGIGTGAALGAVDAVSGATAVYYTSPTNFTGSVSVFFTNNVTITNNMEAPGAYFYLTNSSGTSAALTSNMTTTACMPAGLTFKCVDLNNNVKPAKPIYGAIYGTPTTPVTNYVVSIFVGYGAQVPIKTNIFITITPAISGSAPVITNQPASVTAVAGGLASFGVVAGGSSPLAYQWKFNTNTLLANATNATLTLTNLRVSQAGTYSITITNAVGATNSVFALLTVTNPLPPVMNLPVKSGAGFQFTFIPVVGLTNSVQTNHSPAGGVWNTFTNFPPPNNSSPLTVSDVIAASNRFYRVLINP